MLGTQDILLIGIIVVVLFGATKLPQLGSGIGQAIKNFKKGISEADEIDVTPKNEKQTEISEKEGTKKERTKSED
jgi:sec-independent protein translocase protein TatA